MAVTQRAAKAFCRSSAWFINKENSPPFKGHKIGLVTWLKKRASEVEYWHLATSVCFNLLDDLGSHLSRYKAFPLTMRNVVFEMPRGLTEETRRWTVTECDWWPKAFLRRQKKRQMMSGERERGWRWQRKWYLCWWGGNSREGRQRGLLGC